MPFSIERSQDERKPFGPYRYRILKDDAEFAEYWHDYRGDEMGIRLHSSEHEEDPPFGKCSDFLAGGGPQPLALSRKAVEYLKSLSRHEQ